MDKQLNELKKLFGEYGKIETLEHSSSATVYKFSCDSRELFKKEDLLSHLGTLRFVLLTRQNNECFIYCFRLGTKEGVEKHILKIVNNVNSSLTYGKYILDSDGDINWEYKFDIDCITKDDVYEILCVFMESLLNFAVQVNKTKLKIKREFQENDE